VDVGVTTEMSEKEWAKWCDLLSEMKYWAKYCDENVDEATQSDLSKWATRIKSFVLYMLKMANKYGALNDINNASYIKNRSMIVAGGEDLYYLGK